MTLTNSRMISSRPLNNPTTMNLLIDTHILLWWLADDPALPTSIHRVVADPGNAVFVSAVSAWEIAIKRGLGKLQAPDDLEDQLPLHGFQELHIRIKHMRALESLPHHHKDPFDRLLIAQALTEGLVLASVDGVFAAYGVPLLT
jgi:PIN domain nuclease of toxin-antitoxin system